KQSAKEFLIDKGYDPQYGARPMRRAVGRFLEDPLAEELLRGNVKSGDHVDVIAAEGKLSFQVAESQAARRAPAPAPSKGALASPLGGVRPRRLFSGVLQ